MEVLVFIQAFTLFTFFYPPSMQLRKLLHHFPRTYADLQNAQIEIDDGQYLIFVGKIMSSR